MFSKRYVMVICLGLLFTVAVHASYVESCTLVGQVTSEPETKRLYFLNAAGNEVEREDTTFSFQVTHAKPAGRADSGCTHLVGQVLPVLLNGGYEAVKHIQVKQIVTLNYFAKDDQSMPRRTVFSLINIDTP